MMPGSHFGFLVTLTKEFKNGHKTEAQGQRTESNGSMGTIY